MGWTLQDIRTKVRNVTGRLSPEELTTSQLDQYINNYYVYTFPAEVKLDAKLVNYEFLTTAYTREYDAPTGYTNFVPPAVMDNLQLDWYQNEAYFGENNPYQYQLSTIANGDGVTVLFNGSLGSQFILPGSTFVSAENINGEDVNTDFYAASSFTGAGIVSASVNYTTGAFSVTFTNPPSNGANINVSWIPFVPGRPTAVLWFGNKFTFFPVPDTAYRFKVAAYQIVAPLVEPTDTPDFQEWGPCIAYGASRDIHSDLGEMDAYAQVTALYKEQLAYVLKRTHQNLLNTRAFPNF